MKTCGYILMPYTQACSYNDTADVIYVQIKLKGNPNDVARLELSYLTNK